jgi:catalase
VGVNTGSSISAASRSPKAARIAVPGVVGWQLVVRSALMAKISKETSKRKGFENLKDPEQYLVAGPGGATHQTARGDQGSLTTNQGVVVADNQNTLKSGGRGSSLLEDFAFREKITHFDHERIPERIVHARGSGAHGYFEVTNPIPHLTRASFLAEKGKKTEVFARFSTVAGGAGAGDLPRDVRGFAVKFYTDEGNFDLVGNNIPVFFIQDAIKFPDLIHSVKMEPDRGYPQDATAHDTFWDFISLLPESMNMVLWIMSDRTIPRSLRMMEGFGIHTFRLVNADGKSTFVKFHWRPTIGSASVLWDEAVKINGADPDFHRRDLYEAIAKGAFPEWEFGVQAFDEEKAASFDFDILDATKIIPEEVIPIEVVGRMLLDRNPVNFFAETEQAAFHPGHVVPGIDFTNDPLLQGRLFSYTDTQISRLGGANFHELPINRPRCPMRNLQRDGMRRMDVNPGRVAYEPNSLDPSGPRENPKRGFRTFAAQEGEGETGQKLRLRPESFADHYSQARQFYRSMSAPEQRHIQNAFAFELSKVETPVIRSRVLGHLALVEEALANAVETAIGMEGERAEITPYQAPIDLEPSPALSLVGKAKPMLKGRKVGALVTDGADGDRLEALREALEGEGAELAIVAPKIGGIRLKSGNHLAADMALSGAPSVFFDAVAIFASAEGIKPLLRNSAAIDWVRDAFAHLKVIGHTAPAQLLFAKAGLADDLDEGVIEVNSRASVGQYIEAAKQQRVWDREARVSESDA